MIEGERRERAGPHVTLSAPTLDTCSVEKLTGKYFILISQFFIIERWNFKFLTVKFAKRLGRVFVFYLFIFSR